MRRFERALVAGGAGFLGSWVVELLTSLGVEVVVLDRTSTPAAAPPAEFETVRGELPDFALGELLAARSFDVIFQLVGTPTVPPSVERPLEDLRRNTASTLSVLEAARSCDRFPLVVLVSSAAVYGESVSLPMDEEHPLRPISPYGISKLAAEHYIRVYAAMYGIPAFCVRPFSLYGPRQRKLVVHDLLVRALAGESPLTVLGSPDVSRDFVFARDAAEMLVTLALEAPARGEAYNIASGRPVTLGDLVATLLEVTGSTAPARFSGSVRPGDPLHWHGDPGRAAALGAAASTSIRDGVARTAAWLTEQRRETA
jgi:UDP-glucose 4-epimerase